MAELTLQAAFSPEGGSSRVGLGKLLKSDALVLVRAGESGAKKKTKFLEVVVCETQRGLRQAASCSKTLARASVGNYADK